MEEVFNTIISAKTNQIANYLKQQGYNYAMLELNKEMSEEEIKKAALKYLSIELLNQAVEYANLADKAPKETFTQLIERFHLPWVNYTMNWWRNRNHGHIHNERLQMVLREKDRTDKSPKLAKYISKTMYKGKYYSPRPGFELFKME